MSLDKQKIKHKDHCAGFSLTELLVVIVMLGVISTAGYNLFREQSKINQSQQNLLEMQSNGRAALNFLTQSVVHAGFGCSETNSSFIELQNGASPEESDTVTVLYGTEHIATTGANSTDSITIPVTAVPGKSVNTNDIVSFYPAVRPNRAYLVSSAGTSITLESEVVFVPIDAKVFRVQPVIYQANPTSLELERDDSSGTEVVAYDVVNFQMAYTTENPPDWKEDTGSIKNPKAVWLHLVLRTREPVAGIRHTQEFSLPWDSTKTSFPLANVEDGYHYQEFQAQVWIRNAN